MKEEVVVLMPRRRLHTIGIGVDSDYWHGFVPESHVPCRVSRQSGSLESFQGSDEVGECQGLDGDHAKLTFVEYELQFTVGDTHPGFWDCSNHSA